MVAAPRVSGDGFLHVSRCDRRALRTMVHGYPQIDAMKKQELITARKALRS
jgi:hypothetical protein